MILIWIIIFRVGVHQSLSEGSDVKKKNYSFLVVVTTDFIREFQRIWKVRSVPVESMMIIWYHNLPSKNLISLSSIIFSNVGTRLVSLWICIHFLSPVFSIVAPFAGFQPSVIFLSISDWIHISDRINPYFV